MLFVLNVPWAFYLVFLGVRSAETHLQPNLYHKGKWKTVTDSKNIFSSNVLIHSRTDFFKGIPQSKFERKTKFYYIYLIYT